MVFTIYLHSTLVGRHGDGLLGRVKSGLIDFIFSQDLIPDLYKNTRGQEARMSDSEEYTLIPGNYMFLDGPCNISRMPGTYNPYKCGRPLSHKYLRVPFFSEDRREREISEARARVRAVTPRTWTNLFRRIGKDVGKLAADFSGETERVNPLRAAVVGEGCEVNARLALEVIQGLIFGESRVRIQTVNMIGWSRGAVTALTIANLLQEIFPAIRVNIFAIDPVYGEVPFVPDIILRRLGLFSDTSVHTIVPNNVDNYKAIVSLNEPTQVFDPTLPVRLGFIQEPPERAPLEIIPVPGWHLMIGAELASGRFREMSQVVKHLAVDFLSTNGTLLDPEFERTSLKTPIELCEQYAIMRANLRDYPRFGRLNIRGLLSRDVPLILMYTFFRIKGGHRDYNVIDDYFINQHHQDCFAIAYPRIFDQLQQGNIDLREEILQVNPALFPHVESSYQ